MVDNFICLRYVRGPSPNFGDIFLRVTNSQPLHYFFIIYAKFRPFSFSIVVLVHGCCNKIKNTILSSTVNEVWIVIRFLQTEGNGAAQIHLRLYVDMLFTVNSDDRWVMVRYVICAEYRQFKKQTHNEEN